MPGLFGFFALTPGSKVDTGAASGLLREMAHRMGHRGDEIVETWTDFAEGLAVARIRIPSRPTGTFPDGSEPGGPSRRVFVEGVIHGDTAARLLDLQEIGRPALGTLEGSFSIALWEPQHQRLTLAVDQRASRPLAYTVAGGVVYFAPEVKALLAAPGVCKDLDPAALGIFLGAGHVLSTQTLFTAVRRLSAGQRLVLDRCLSGSSAVRVEGEDRYRLSASGDGTAPRDLEAELCSLVRGVVRRYAAEPATVVFLSGGVDSRIIAAEAQDAARTRGEKICTVSWGAPERRLGSDVEVASAVARRLGSVHRRFDREISDYRARFFQTNYLLDGLTDLAAYHPHDQALMRALAGGCARIVLRGDECFGYEGHVGSIEDALAMLGLRRLAQLRHLDRFLFPDTMARWGGAASAALDAIVASLHGAHPDDAKDLLYFRHRLQSYLGSAAYLKQVVVEHRTPLLDERILAFNGRVPARLRADKRLFCRAAKQLSPDLFAIPLATRDNLEDWRALVSDPSPVYDHVARELGDRESGIWEYVDREALLGGLERAAGAGGSVLASPLYRVPRRIGRAVLRAVPPVRRSLIACVQRSSIRFDQICLRVLVLKSFHDLFVSGDGSRRALEARLPAR